MDLKKTYITFGGNHRHVINGVVFDGNCVALIESDSYERGRELAFEIFGPKWSFEYPEPNYDFDHMAQFFHRGVVKLANPEEVAAERVKEREAKKRRVENWKEAAARYINWKEAAARYIENPTNCPYCEGSNYEGSEVEIDYRSATQDMTCADCNKTWRDTFTLSSVDPVDYDKGEF